MEIENRSNYIVFYRDESPGRLSADSENLRFDERRGNNKRANKTDSAVKINSRHNKRRRV